LYQADFLLRFYKFRIDELTFSDDGNLVQKFDPKLVWALKNLKYFPVEVNKADYEMLIRVPGIGPRSARRILQERSQTKIKDIQQLNKLGAVAKRAIPFVLLDGKSPQKQPTLFER
jgi:predicted DNA-binding helix-hairpin-helix protein